jgi:hypothetical protein
MTVQQENHPGADPTAQEKEKENEGAAVDDDKVGNPDDYRGGPIAGSPTDPDAQS